MTNSQLNADAFKPDLIIERAVVVEVKSAAGKASAHQKQVLTEHAEITK